MPGKLGKQPRRDDPRTFGFARYAAALPEPPPTTGWEERVTAWPMFANDTVGDCTCAAAGHMIECWTANAGTEATVTDADVLAAYTAVGGYNPADPSTDQGAAIIDVLNYWRRTGIAGHKITAFMGMAAVNHTHVLQAISLFGGVDIGVQLPAAVQDTGNRWPAPTDPADPAWAPGSWGGHSVHAVDYNPEGVTVVTWGELTTVDWTFWDLYLDECWAIVSPDILAGAVDPQGFDLAQLQADLAAL